MTETPPLACSLGASDLQERLAAIARLGADSLVDQRIEDGRHVLRFSGDAATRERLDAIVAAEAECCAFLGLDLTEADDQLVLTLTAPELGQPVADELARAFGRSR